MTTAANTAANTAVAAVTFAARCDAIRAVAARSAPTGDNACGCESGRRVRAAAAGAALAVAEGIDIASAATAAGEQATSEWRALEEALQRAASDCPSSARAGRAWVGDLWGE